MVAVHVNILDCFPWFDKGLVGLRGKVHGDVEEVHLNPVGLSSWDLQAVLLHDPVDLLQGQLRLPVGELAGGESVVIRISISLIVPDCLDQLRDWLQISLELDR